MTAGAAGTVENPGTNVGQKAGLNRVIMDVGFSEIERQLTCKALWVGRETVKVDRGYPSNKRCSACGYTLKRLALSQRDWRCPECNTSHDRDLNAARNILAAGKAVLDGADAQRVHE
jgi:putative transposase